MAQKTTITKDTPPDIIERDIALTRVEMGKTIDEIEERFSARHWKAVARETIKEKASTAASRGKELANRAKRSARKIGLGAKDSSLKAKDGLLRFMKDNPSAVRVVAFELGAWIVIASKSMLNRKSRMQMKEESGGTEYSKAKIMSIEEVEQKVESAALMREGESKKAA